MSPRFREDEAVRLGADVVARLIPHRRPLLMVDAIEAFRAAPRPTLWALRHVSANEEVFAGHFPGLHLWPGIYTIEGLGQSTLLCGALLHRIAARGGDAGAVVGELAGLERAARARRPAVGSADEAPAPLGVSGHVDVKLLAPVFAGQTLRYRVELTHAIGGLGRFEVEAEADGRAVARGTMTGGAGAG